MIRKTFTLIVLFITFQSCTDSIISDKNNEDTGKIELRSKENGTRLFKEILFFEGISKNEDLKIRSLSQSYDILSEIRKNNPDSFEEVYQSTINDLIVNISNIDSTYFNRFNEAITSKTPNEIKAMLSETHRILLLAQITSETFQNTEHISKIIIEKPNLKNLLTELESLSGELKAQKLLEINNEILEYTSNSEDDNIHYLVPCTPGVVICVVHTFAAVTATAAVVANAIGVVTVVLKVAAVLWDKQWIWSSVDPNNPTLSDEILISEIANAY